MVVYDDDFLTFSFFLSPENNKPAGHCSTEHLAVPSFIFIL